MTNHEQEIAQIRWAREVTERNRAALKGKPGKFYDYLRGCWVFRTADGEERRLER